MTKVKHHIVFLDNEGIGPTVKLPEFPFNHTWASYPYTQPDQVVERLRDATIVMTCSVPLRKEHLVHLPNLKMISIALTGTDGVDLDYCHEHGILVTNVPGYAQNTVAEHILAMIFSLTRQTSSYHQLLNKVSKGETEARNIYFDYRIRDVRGLILGIIGYGTIAKRLAELASALGMQVRFFDRNGKYQGDEFVSFHEILSESDVVSVCCPLKEDTKDLISREEISLMKPDALLINAARGGIVNEPALIEAIQNAKIGGAALDGSVEEPIQANDALFQIIDYPNFILNPHVAWSSVDAMQTLIQRTVQNIIDFAQGKTPISVVKKERLCQA
ncbi:NAD(P)-dependent oxidoreductase [Acinetobacter sp.]|uniref:NAD(P)-dependent oxidoreductase n=1 Tax=Acinetobacter sp. TaxID=472 RepID=UPI00258A4576|nr:NAD(P)-dependent oxidoreductase [Acinetobacter sp.]